MSHYRRGVEFGCDRTNLGAPKGGKESTRHCGFATTGGVPFQNNSQNQRYRLRSQEEHQKALFPEEFARWHEEAKVKAKEWHKEMKRKKREAHRTYMFEDEKAAGQALVEESDNRFQMTSGSQHTSILRNQRRNNPFLYSSPSSAFDTTSGRKKSTISPKQRHQSPSPSTTTARSPTASASTTHSSSTYNFTDPIEALAREEYAKRSSIEKAEELWRAKTIVAPRREKATLLATRRAHLHEVAIANSQKGVELEDAEFLARTSVIEAFTNWRNSLKSAERSEAKKIEDSSAEVARVLTEKQNNYERDVQFLVNRQDSEYATILESYDDWVRIWREQLEALGQQHKKELIDRSNLITVQMRYEDPVVGKELLIEAKSGNQKRGKKHTVSFAPPEMTRGGRNTPAYTPSSEQMVLLASPGAYYKSKLRRLCDIEENQRTVLEENEDFFRKDVLMKSFEMEGLKWRRSNKVARREHIDKLKSRLRELEVIAEPTGRNSLENLSRATLQSVFLDFQRRRHTIQVVEEAEEKKRQEDESRATLRRFDPNPGIYWSIERTKCEKLEERFRMEIDQVVETWIRTFFSHVRNLKSLDKKIATLIGKEDKSRKDLEQREIQLWKHLQMVENYEQLHPPPRPAADVLKIDGDDEGYDVRATAAAASSARSYLEDEETMARRGVEKAERKWRARFLSVAHETSVSQIELTPSLRQKLAEVESKESFVRSEILKAVVSWQASFFTPTAKRMGVSFKPIKFF